ncbi:MAG: hypothetical protein ACPL7D_07770 [Candidatus Sumerlaeaceae bacterium]
MQTRREHKNIGWCPARAIVAMALLVALVPVSVPAGERKPSDDKKTTSTTAAAGFVVNLDANGKPVQAVPPQVVKKAPASRHEGLVVENNPAGGITVDLKGRFHRAVTTTKDAQGQLHFNCQPVVTDSVFTQGKE